MLIQPNLAGRRQFFVGSRQKWNPVGNFGRFPISESGREQRKLETELEQKISFFMRGIVEKNRSVPFQNRHFSTKMLTEKVVLVFILICGPQEKSHRDDFRAGYFSAVFVFRCRVDQIASLSDRNRRWWKPYKRVCRQLVQMVVIWQQPKQVLGGNKYTCRI